MRENMTHSMEDAVNEPSPNGFLSGSVDANHHITHGDMEHRGDEQNGVASEEDAVSMELERPGLLPTGLCYDGRMKLHANADFGDHPHHPEDPARIEHIFNALKKAGLVYNGTVSDVNNIILTNPHKYMWRIPARPATQEEITLVHHPGHFAWVQKLGETPTDELRQLTKAMDQGRVSLYVGSMTFYASLISAGGAIETCKAVVEGKVKNAIAVIRPPGHHAEYDSAMGFCLFNNVPVAAKVCQRTFPDLCRKILILDWDVHHGNGIQNMFYDDPNILYISIHVYNDGKFYPGKPDNEMTPDGGLNHCGASPGLGKNVNIGWHDQGMGDGEYMAAFQKIVMPIGYEFDPDLVIISAGFDAAAGDELGGCFVTPTCYAHMTHMLMSLAKGKVAVCLEGGYNLQAISASALAVAQTLMGEPLPRLELPNISKEAARTLARVQAFQAPYWECMRPGVVDVEDLQAAGSLRLHDVVRQAQRQVLSSKHKMIPMYVQRDALFRSFENQILVTPDLVSCRKLLVVIHDPPQLLAQPDPLDNTLDLHNGWVTDPVTRYIDWAVSKRFGVMDINIPHYITHEDDVDPHTSRASESQLAAQIQELTCFIWDNYLELFDHVDDIFILGVGNACIGINTLLLGRDCTSRIRGVVSFNDSTALRPVKSDVDPNLSAWYKENSQVFVADNHACWSDPVSTRKVQKKRFGQVVRSKSHGLANMMKLHFDDVEKWVMWRVKENDKGQPIHRA